MKDPLAWVRVSKNRMVSGPYTVWNCSGSWLCWYGVSDKTTHAKTLGRFQTEDEGFARAERHDKDKESGR